MSRHFGPVWKRKQLHDLVIALRQEGLSYSEIIREIYEKRRVKLAKSNISDWVNNRHHPFGSVYELPYVPTPELAYVIGVAKGDASLRAQRWSYRLRLRVIDKEFAEEFDRCASTVFKSRRHSIRWLPEQGLWSVEVCSVLLYQLLRRPLARLRPIVSHCRKCAAAFLRGFFDSEASMSGRSLEVTNGSLGVLSLAEELLETLGILATGPHMAHKGGHLVKIKGKFYRANKNIYRLHVRAQSLSRYASQIGFAIGRKQLALNLALGVV